jgi:F-type H+-transporting ATPase subunit delta
MASGAAKRYAQAVFSLAKERGTLDRWQADLSVLNKVMADPVAEVYLGNPNVPVEDKVALFEKVLADAQPEARNLARLLIQRHRLNIIPDLCRLYLDADLAERGIAIADVTTAEPLGPDVQQMIRAKLHELIGKEIELRLHIDPSIIGGIVARVGDQLIDGSVINQLRRLRARLAAPA